MTFSGMRFSCYETSIDMFSKPGSSVSVVSGYGLDDQAIKV
jgi:hypothetical protein